MSDVAYILLTMFIRKRTSSFGDVSCCLFVMLMSGWCIQTRIVEQGGSRPPCLTLVTLLLSSITSNVLGSTSVILVLILTVQESVCRPDK